MLDTMTLPEYAAPDSPPRFSARRKREGIDCVCSQNLDEVVEEHVAADSGSKRRR
jgi:hypothetical protein